MDGSTANLLRRFLQRAPDALTDEELLTLLLHAGTGAEEPRTLAARLIGQFGSLGAALSASPEELASVEGMDASRALLLRLVTELHRRYYLSRPFSGARLTGTTDFGNFLLPFFYGAREELVYLLALDAAGRLLTCTCLSEERELGQRADAQAHARRAERECQRRGAGAQPPGGHCPAVARGCGADTPPAAGTRRRGHSAAGPSGDRG